MKDIIFNENCSTGLSKLPDNSIDCCVTSPPYYGLRDYGHDAQIGMEETPEIFIQSLIKVFDEVKRVLKPNGTIWVNLGDSYWGGKGMSGQASPEKQEQRSLEGKTINKKHQQLGGHGKMNPKDGKHDFIKPKDLIGIPWMFAFAMRNSGWYLRQDIIWNKPNPMPESVIDRCTKAHEYIFLMSKSSKYYYDADSIKTKSKDPVDDLRRFEKQNWDNKNTPDNLRNGIRPRSKFGNREGQLNGLHSGNDYFVLEKANKRSVWTVNTKPYREAHFATFPEDLIVDCIKADCPEGGIVLDPFMGSGTTAVVSKKLGRSYIGFEINESYIKIANKRLHNEIGLFI